MPRFSLPGFLFAIAAFLLAWLLIWLIWKLHEPLTAIGALALAALVLVQIINTPDDPAKNNCGRI